MPFRETCLVEERIRMWRITTLDCGAFWIFAGAMG